MHENLTPVSEIRSGSDRSFGLVFAAIFAIVSAWPLINGEPIRWWAAVATVGFGGIALIRPILLSRLNRLWFRFGLLLGKVMTPIVMGLLFFGAFTPTALVMRAFGKDSLRLRKAKDVSTYWVHREGGGPAKGSMKNQF